LFRMVCNEEEKPILRICTDVMEMDPCTYTILAIYLHVPQ
jgi:hypothetical protein